MNPFGLLFAGAGVFTLVAAMRDWDWFMNARKARFMVALLTRTGARIFYGALGLALLVLGVLGAAGVVDLSR